MDSLKSVEQQARVVRCPAFCPADSECPEQLQAGCTTAVPAAGQAGQTHPGGPVGIAGVELQTGGDAVPAVPRRGLPDCEAVDPGLAVLAAATECALVSDAQTGEQGPASALPALFQINAGQRGLLVSMTPADALRASDAKAAELIA